MREEPTIDDLLPTVSNLKCIISLEDTELSDSNKIPYSSQKYKSIYDDWVVPVQFEQIVRKYEGNNSLPTLYVEEEVVEGDEYEGMMTLIIKRELTSEDANIHPLDPPFLREKKQAFMDDIYEGASQIRKQQNAKEDLQVIIEDVNTFYRLFLEHADFGSDLSTKRLAYGNTLIKEYNDAMRFLKTNNMEQRPKDVSIIKRRALTAKSIFDTLRVIQEMNRIRIHADWSKSQIMFVKYWSKYIEVY